MIAAMVDVVFELYVEQTERVQQHPQRRIAVTADFVALVPTAAYSAAASEFAAVVADNPLRRHQPHRPHSTRPTWLGLPSLYQRGRICYATTASLDAREGCWRADFHRRPVRELGRRCWW